MSKDLRKYAEEMLSIDNSRKPSVPTKDVKKLVHEVSVHQIELELQNEELRQAQIELAGSRDRYLALYDHAPVGYLTIDNNDLITECNLTTAALLGLDRIKITGKQKFSHFVAREAQKDWFSFKCELSSTAVIQKSELEMHRDSGSTFFVHLEGKTLDMDGTGEKRILITLTDITEQKRLQRQIEYLARFPSEDPNPVLRILDGGVLEYANPVADIIIQAWKTKVGRKVPILWQERINTAIDYEKTAMYELEIGHDTYAVWIAPVTKHQYANLYLHKITELKQAHEREKRSAILAAASKMSLETINAMKEGIILLNMDGTIKSVNRGLIELSGYSRDFFEGEHAAQLISQLIDEEHVHEAVQALNHAMDGKLQQLDEMILIGKEGDRIPVMTNIVFIKDEDGKPEIIVVTIQDIMDVKEAEVELRALASKLMLTEEQERKHLAVALHDTINQTLALAKIKLGALNQMLDSDDTRDIMLEIRKLFSLAIEQTRTLSFELSPPILYELGLYAAVEWLGEKMKEEYKFEFSVTGSNIIESLDDSLKILIFQSIRELLTNVGKHASAGHVKVTFIPDNKRLTVVIEDDGKGFDLFVVHSRHHKQSGIGLFSIKDRMKHLGGSFKLDSAPGKGTRVTISVPLQDNQNN